MIWFFERDNEQAEVATIFDNHTSEYVVRQMYADGSEITERFRDGSQFGARLQLLAGALRAAGWTQGQSPLLLREGWPRRHERGKASGS